jgi:hypothetical protein
VSFTTENPDSACAGFAFVRSDAESAAVERTAWRLVAFAPSVADAWTMVETRRVALDAFAVVATRVCANAADCVLRGDDRGSFDGRRGEVSDARGGRGGDRRDAVAGAIAMRRERRAPSLHDRRRGEASRAARVSGVTSTRGLSTQEHRTTGLPVHRCV